MPKGSYPLQYFQTPRFARSRTAAYEILDTYTGEFFAEETGLHEHIDLVVPLPPLSLDGRFVKGLCFSQAMDFLVDQFPQLKDLFICAAHSMWSSYPWSQSADAYLVCYDNPHREAWFRKANPTRAAKVLIPLQDADWTNEYTMAPQRVLDRDIDLLCISRLHTLKNVPLIARALLLYRRKYPFEPIRMTLIAGKKNAYCSESMSEVERDQYSQIQRILGRPEDFIDFVDSAAHFSELPSYYSRARCYILGSLLEGKNRCLNEALSCNTPVLCFADLNVYARGATPCIAPTAGLTAGFDEESLADAIHDVLINEGDFRPRAAYLTSSGRRRFLTECTTKIPYFQQQIPDLKSRGCWDNPWIDLAVQQAYDTSLHDFVYGRRTNISSAKGLERAAELTDYYAQKMEL